ncbi:putative Ig domain-containing protein, partial [uncultured Vibrio sp.]|uniref:putative Ig domain-containing protein n=1 Tax=uncultured Vibrio sp. TaxID=114054 RepID=UPI00260330AD
MMKFNVIGLLFSSIMITACHDDDSPPTNTAPVFDSVVEFSSFSDANFSYQIQASEADGDSLTYEILNAPMWMTVDPSSGLISGYLAAADVGEYSFNVLISDGIDTVESIGSYVGVLAPSVNNAPTFDSVVEFSSFSDANFSYQIQASEADGDSLTYEILNAPMWMTVDPSSGLIS